VDPALYGAERHPKLGPVQPRRDATDALLLAEAERRGMPLLAICYGVQRLNVFRGGDLHQDLRSAGYERYDHRVFPGTGHDVRLDLSAWPRPLWALREAIRALVPPGAGGEFVFRVNTSHHQAVRTPAPGAAVFAQAPDGVIEGIVFPGEGRFLLGVQWHPERDPESGLSRAIFRSFVEACGAYRPL
jgi:putative glutamine amidotransferase